MDHNIHFHQILEDLIIDPGQNQNWLV